MINFWEFIKDFPYWERFKINTYYYFHPINHGIDISAWIESRDEDDLYKHYNEYKQRKAEKKRKKNENNKNKKKTI